MKILHSWIDVEGSRYKKNQKWFLTMTLLSILAAKKSFGNIHLVTTKKGKKLFEKLQFPYDSITTELEGKEYSSDAYSLGKIDAYILQDEPYLHIDNDTFLFEPRIIPQYKRFSFGFPDISYPLTVEKFEFLHKTYLQPYTKIKDYFDEVFWKQTNFDVIPNCSIMGGHDFQTIKEVYTSIKELYHYNREDISSKTGYTSHLLEQFLFFPMAGALKSKGSDKVENNHKWINENSYIWSQDLPLELEYGVCSIHGDKLTDYNGTLQNYKGIKTYCFDRNLLLLKDNFFGGFCHLGHYSNDVIIRNIFFEKLKKYYDCDKYVKNINKLHAVKEEWESPIFNTLF